MKGKQATKKKNMTKLIGGFRNVVHSIEFTFHEFDITGARSEVKVNFHFPRLALVMKKRKNIHSFVSSILKRVNQIQKPLLVHQPMDGRFK